MIQRAIVLSNGEINDPGLIRQRLTGWQDALVIGADAGSRHANTLDLKLDVMIGDFDSLDTDTRAGLEAHGTLVVPAPAEKDETDLELALMYAAEQGAQHIVMLGTMGGRLDMALASVFMLSHPALTHIHTEIWVDRQTAWLIRPPGGDIHGRSGDTVSLIPIGGNSLGVRTDFLAYPLQNETLIFGPARGVSNVMSADVAHVALADGPLLVVHTPGRA
jgi:thiamine pyrophosphokinase